MGTLVPGHQHTWMVLVLCITIRQAVETLMRCIATTLQAAETHAFYRHDFTCCGELMPCIATTLQAAEKLNALYQGTTLELAEKLIFLKGTAVSPYVSGCKQVRL
jgi:hypothetical protein